MWLFDCLVRWEYEHHREEWERDGKPDGFFWRTEGRTFWKSDMAKKRLSVAWLFVTPSWAATAPECRRWLQHLRVATLIWNAAILAILIRLLFFR
jgi:hypothetical protein